MKRYAYYQPNKKDLKDKYGDCTIRALSKALGVSWIEAFDLMVPICREEQTTNIFDCPLDIRKRSLAKLGFEYHSIPVVSGKKRPTVDGFTKEHKEGTYILNVAHHEVAAVDGRYYDIWDCGHNSVYGYFERKV